MRKIAVVAIPILAVSLAWWSFALAQQPGEKSDQAVSKQSGATQQQGGLNVPVITPGPGWLTCPRCINGARVRENWKEYKVDGHQFDPHDLSGVWAVSRNKGGTDAEGLFVDETPGKVAFTPYGQKLYNDTHSDSSADGLTIANSKDPEMICDPLGYPRSMTYNYGFEFSQEKDRTYQFFEWAHSYRTIWTDGRKLPPDPPTLRYMGYSVGHWEGDTFVIEASGFDDRSWVSQDRKSREFGFPHSDEMTVVERYKRLSYGTLSIEMTITDPKVYAKPWVTGGEASLRPGTELWEYECVPSESAQFNINQTAASAGAKSFQK